MRCTLLARILIYIRRICALISILCIIISFFLPWYYIDYQFETADTNNDEAYESSAYMHAWYIYENLDCELKNCSGHPGALFSEEGLNLWIIGIDDGRFGMRLIFLICWGLVTANFFVLLVSVVRKNKGKIIAYIAFLLSLFATIIFLLLPTSFTPCEWENLAPQTGPCHSFMGSSYFDMYYLEKEFKWGPYAAWYTTLISAFLCGIGLCCAVFSPKPQYNPIDDEEEQRILRDNYWK